MIASKSRSIQIDLALILFGFITVVDLVWQFIFVLELSLALFTVIFSGRYLEIP
jgi:hypothetical protein